MVVLRTRASHEVASAICDSRNYGRRMLSAVIYLASVLLLPTRNLEAEMHHLCCARGPPQLVPLLNHYFSTVTSQPLFLN